MKKFIYLILLAIPMFMASCEKDNYDEPKETFRGKIIDKGTGKPFQAAPGGEGIRIRMMEYSWSDNPLPYDFYAMMDGTFQNTKIFAGEYGVTPSGAFVPVPEERMKIKGTVEKTWEVEPLLRVEWVGEPVLNANGTVTIKVKVSRGTDNIAYQNPLSEAWLFVNETKYVSDGYYSSNFSTKIAGDAIQIIEFDKVIEITSGQPTGYDPTEDASYTPFPSYSRKYFLRFGVCTNLMINGAKRYNFTPVRSITTLSR